MAISRFSKKVALIVFFVGLSSLAIGYALGAYHTKSEMAPLVGNQLRTKDENYPYISPLIACVSPDKGYFGEYKALEKKLVDYISEKKRVNDATDIGVYVRDLGTGHWAGVDETSVFLPASLFKVPIMIAYLKQADADPQILKKRLGSSTVAQLLKTMIVESDNVAKDILLQHVDVRTLESVLDDLGIDSPQTLADNEIYTISPQKYSLLFRSLYNATLASKEMSNYALSLLTETTYTEGIVASIPVNVPVAHKFGLHSKRSAPLIGAELHDCGIVYRDPDPYFICVMTKGGDEARLKPIIQDISRIVYDDFHSTSVE